MDLLGEEEVGRARVISYHKICKYFTQTFLLPPVFVHPETHLGSGWGRPPDP